MLRPLRVSRVLAVEVLPDIRQAVAQRQAASAGHPPDAGKDLQLRYTSWGRRGSQGGWKREMMYSYDNQYLALILGFQFLSLSKNFWILQRLCNVIDFNSNVTVMPRRRQNA